MGGAANVLALAQMVDGCEAKGPARVLIPAVEKRRWPQRLPPLDIFTSRKGRLVADRTAIASTGCPRPIAGDLGRGSAPARLEDVERAGRRCRPRVSTAGINTRSRTFSFASITICASASTLAAPPMSFS